MKQAHGPLTMRRAPISPAPKAFSKTAPCRNAGLMKPAPPPRKQERGSMRLHKAPRPRKGQAPASPCARRSPAGDSLFRIVDASRLRLTAHVAEIDATDLGQPYGAWFRPAGSDVVVDIAGHNGRLIGAGGAVDPVSRTVPVVFEFDNPEGALRAGTSVSARVRTDETFEGAAVPASALIDDAGQDVVFIMADGENWERRIVRIALRDGAYVGVASGVAPGERVVSRGAYFVHLAASGPAEAGHGHAH